MIITVMVTLMATIIVTAIVTTVAQYIKWQFFILGNPLYSLIIWHVLIFTFVFAVFYDSKRGFRTTLHIISKIIYKLENYQHKNSVEYQMYNYQENAKKITTKTILLPLLLTLFVAFLVLSQTIFLTSIVSGSMEPTFKVGDLVLMQNIKVTPETGDIILFRIPSQQLPISHRVYLVSEEGIRTKGDANPSIDSWVLKKEQIIGEVVTVGGKPVLIHNIGSYFVIDARPRQMYGPEYNAIAKIIRAIKSAGVIIFIACIILYIFMSMKSLKKRKEYSK